MVIAMDQSLLERCRVLPVITASDPDQTVRLCQVLARAGMAGVEITLRTPEALASITAVKAEVPGVVVAAGTVLNAADMAAARRAGADFCVSPGLTPALLDAGTDTGTPLLPGVASASEIMLGLDRGYRSFKLFPAAAAGGIPMLKSLGGPFPDVRFCPTGGLNPDNFREYLALPNVLCCGGSWMVADALVSAGLWQQIEDLAAQAMTISAHERSLA